MVTPAIPPLDGAGFRPARGLGNTHVQTLAGKVLRPDLRVPLRRQRVTTPDGDFLDLDFAGWPGEPMADPHGAPVVLVLHGLEGTTRRRYMATTFHALLDAGLRPVGLNFRGCSGEPNLLPRTYHSGETSDLRFVLDLLRDRFGGPLGLVGYSLGGNVALKFLGEAGGETGGDTSRLVGAAAAVSVPFDLAAGADRLEQGLLSRFYSHYFLSKLKRKVREKRDLLRQDCDPDRVLRSRTIRQFDDLVTAPIHGFRDASDYYHRSSSARFISGIRVPTLVLHSRDDPFLPPDRIPVAAMDANPWVTAIVTERGGHVAFVAGSIRRPDFWGERVLAAFLAGRLGVGDAARADATALDHARPAG